MPSSERRKGPTCECCEALGVAAPARAQPLTGLTSTEARICWHPAVVALVGQGSLGDFADFVSAGRGPRTLPQPFSRDVTKISRDPAHSTSNPMRRTTSSWTAPTKDQTASSATWNCTGTATAGYASFEVIAHERSSRLAAWKSPDAGLEGCKHGIDECLNISQCFGGRGPYE